MEALSHHQEVCVKATVENLYREILPLLGKPDHGQFLKDRLEEELYRHEILFSHERVSPFRLIVVTIVALVAGYAVGSF